MFFQDINPTWSKKKKKFNFHLEYIDPSNLLSVLKLSDFNFDLVEFFGHLAMVLVHLDRFIQRLTWQYWLVTEEKEI